MDLFVDDYDRPGSCLETYPKLKQIFENPRGHWFCNPKTPNLYYLTQSVNRLMQRAAPRVPLCVLYNIPGRDAGSYSKGGAESDRSYLTWIKAFADGITPHNDPIIILEPDAIPLAVQDQDKPFSSALNSRLKLLDQAVPILKTAGSQVYIDLGHPRWLKAEVAGGILQKFNSAIQGFSVNVSNFIQLDECIEWAQRVSSASNGAHFVIDTSRNGTPHEGSDWCNPPEKRLGHIPTLETGIDKCDAFLWIKIPGESDGYCNGGPKAGTYWPEYGSMLTESLV